MPARKIVEQYQKILRPAHPRGNAVQNVIGLLNLGQDPAHLMRAIDRYAAYCTENHKSRTHRFSAANFFLDGGAYEEFLDTPAVDYAGMDPVEIVKVLKGMKPGEQKRLIDSLPADKQAKVHEIRRYED